MFTNKYHTNADQELYLQPEVFQIGSPACYAATVTAATVAGEKTKPNEDALAIKQIGNGLALAVFDGATSLKKIPAHDTIGMSGARFASHFLRDQFLQLSTFDDSTISYLNQQLRIRTGQFEGIDLNDPTTLPTSTATLVFLDPDRDLLTLQNISDSFCIVKLRNAPAQMVTPDPLAELERIHYERIRALAKEKQISNREARNDPEIFRSLIAALQQSHNNPSGTGAGVVNGDPFMDRYIFRASFKLSDVEAILLGSDGLPAPQEPLTTAENIDKLLERVTTEGLASVLAHKKQLEDRDPNWDTPRWKHSDDAAGILCRLQRK